MAQLICLLRAGMAVNTINLFLPYFPYARQDKSFHNNKTFALYPFLSFLDRLYFNKITTIDIHNEQAIRNYQDFHVSFINKTPEQRIAMLMGSIGTIWLVYPDKGASQRYKFDFNLMSLHFEKQRDESTGEIVKFELSNGSEVWLSEIEQNHHPILIVDDLCDGGATFIAIANYFKSRRIEDIYLFVSHGLFTKGTQPLFNAGYKRIWTYDKEIINGL